jgi:hypothetical protein
MPDFRPIEIDVLRALAEARDTRWLYRERIAHAAGRHRDDPAVLEALGYLRRAGYVVRHRDDIHHPYVYALTECGAAELAALDTVRSAA